ncbi:hypothetical protein L9F63_010549, partial [Diploptera punctata]
LQSNCKALFLGDVENVLLLPHILAHVLSPISSNFSSNEWNSTVFEPSVIGQEILFQGFLSIFDAENSSTLGLTFPMRLHLAPNSGIDANSLGSLIIFNMDVGCNSFSNFRYIFFTLYMYSNAGIFSNTAVFTLNPILHWTKLFNSYTSVTLFIVYVLISGKSLNSTKHYSDSTDCISYKCPSTTYVIIMSIH